jgi:hypothetical protein
MALADFLREGAEPNGTFRRSRSSPRVGTSCWAEDALDGVDDDSFVARVLAMLESGQLSPATSCCR